MYLQRHFIDERQRQQQQQQQQLLGQEVDHEPPNTALLYWVASIMQSAKQVDVDASNNHWPRIRPELIRPDLFSA